MSNSYWEDDYKALYISNKLYQKLSELACEKSGGYTGEGIVTDLVEEILQDYVDSQSVMDSKAIFQVETHFDEIFPYVVISSTNESEQDNNFLGKMDVGSKEAVVRIAKDGWGISEDQIQFIN